MAATSFRLSERAENRSELLGGVGSFPHQAALDRAVELATNEAKATAGSINLKRRDILHASRA